MDPRYIRQEVNRALASERSSMDYLARTIDRAVPALVRELKRCADALESIADSLRNK